MTFAEQQQQLAREWAIKTHKWCVERARSEIMNLEKAYYILRQHPHRYCGAVCLCKADNTQQLNAALSFLLRYVEQDLINDL